MVESVAHLVDHMFSEAPVRQFVLTFPIRVSITCRRLPTHSGNFHGVINPAYRRAWLHGLKD